MSLATDLVTVTLTTSTLSEGITYTLTVNNITDRATMANTIAVDSTATFTFVAQLIITGTSPTGYVWDTLDVGKSVYIDRTFTYATVPAAYVGLDYLQTANGDKGSTGASFITFDVNQDVTVYVAHDDRNAALPTWMSGFTDTGDNLSGDTTLSLYARDFTAGAVTLGGNEAGTNSMYTVVVGPKVGGVINQPPTALIGASITSGNVGEVLSFDGIGSTDSDGTIASYDWDFSDGQTASGASVAHAWTSAGTFTVQLTLTDDGGAVASDTVTVTILTGADLTPPQVTLSEVEIDGTINDPTIGQVNVGGSNFLVVGGAFSGTAAIASSPETIAISATDASGNTATRTVSIVQ